LLFTPELLDILPPPAATKIRRIEAARDAAKAAHEAAETHLRQAQSARDASPTPGNLSALAMAEAAADEARAAFDAFDFIPSAIRYLDLNGAYSRFVRHGVTLAHVGPTVEPVRDYIAAVADLRQRLAALDAQERELDAAVARGSLSTEWRELHATDLGLVRLALERIEERIICAAEDAGISINRRAALDAAALLEIERA
jgi:hypothetical protein